MSMAGFQQDTQSTDGQELQYLGNATVSEYGESYTPSASGISADQEPGLIRTRFGNRFAWGFILRAQNELAAIGGFEIDQEFDDTANEATTEAFNPRLNDLLGPYGVAVPTDEERAHRDIVCVAPDREVMFTKEFELTVHKLRKWKPRIILNRRTLESDDD